MTAPKRPTAAAEATTDETADEYVRPTTNVERREPKDVHEAIRCVMLDLGGIPKMTTDKHRERTGSTASDERGVNYAYRSIDQITGDAQRSFGLYGCTWRPKVLGSSEREFTMGQNNTRWVDVELEVVYWLVGPGGAEIVVPTTKHFQSDGSYVEAPDERAWYMTGDVSVYGPVKAVGRDNSDKGHNKAMTQAFKQVLLQALSIGDPQDEGDHVRHEQASGPRVVTDAMAAEFRRKVSQLPKAHAAKLVDELKAEKIPLPQSMDTEQYGRANALLQLHVIQAHQEANGDTSVPEPDVAASLGLTDDSVEPPATDDEIREAKAFLMECVEGVPESGEDGRALRSILVSNLRGRFGDPESWTFDEILAATAIAAAWPDEPTADEPEPTAELPSPDRPVDAAESGASPDPAPNPQESAPADETRPLTPLEYVRREIGPDVPDAVIDEAIAEVVPMKGPERKDALRERGLPLGGSVSDVGLRLAVALVKERTEQSA